MWGWVACWVARVPPQKSGVRLPLFVSPRLQGTSSMQRASLQGKTGTLLSVLMC